MGDNSREERRLVRDWLNDEEACRHICDCFVTGEWKDDAAELLHQVEHLFAHNVVLSTWCGIKTQLIALQDDELFGEFEDLEEADLKEEEADPREDEEVSG